MHRRTPIALIALLGVATAIVSAAPNLRPGKIPVFIAPGEVTIDGAPRPDLGRSFSDTIAGGLLQSRAYTIIDPEIAPIELDADAGPEGAAPTPEAIAASAAIGAHYAFIPRLVVEGEYHRLTLKKVRVSDGEVTDIYEKSTTSAGRAAMFELLDDTLKVVYADMANDRTRQERADRAAVIDYDPEPEPESRGQVFVVPDAPQPTVQYPPTEIVSPPKPKRRPSITEPDPLTNKLPNSIPVSSTKPPKKSSEDKADTPPEAEPENRSKPIDVSAAPEAEKPLLPEYAGRLRAINTDWHFCIIEVAKRGELQVDDILVVRASTSPEPLGKLRVSKVEGSQVVADSIDVPLEKLRAGLKVFRWLED